MREPSRRRLGFDDLIAQGVAHEIRGGVAVQSAHEIGAVGFRGLNREMEHRSDFLSSAAFRQKLSDFPLPGGKAAAGGRKCGRSGTAINEAGQDNVRNFRGEECAVSLHGVDGGDEIGCRVGLEEIATRAGRKDLINHGIRVVHGEHYNFRARGGLGNFLGRFEAVQERHGDIQQGHIWPCLRGFLNRVATVRGLRDNAPTGLNFK